MGKFVNKKIIQEAIKAELNKEIVSEGPLDNRIFDAPARAVGAVGNMFANIGGQMKLGSINKQLDRTAQRIEVDWGKAEDVASKLASKMQTSKNPQVANSGRQAAANIASAGQDIRNATNKLRSISKNGADKDAGGIGQSSDADPDFQTRIKKDEYGIEYAETPVERWVNSFGGNYQDLGKTKRNHMNQLFMELRSAGINPFKVPKEKQALLAHYAMRRNAQIAADGVDPYPNFEHFEMVLGKKAADEMRAKAKTEMGEPEEQEQKIEDQDMEEIDDTPKVSKPLLDFMAKARGFANKQGVAPNMMDKWLAGQMEKIKNIPSLTPTDKEFINRLILKGGGQPVNAFGGGDFNVQPPTPPVSSKTPPTPPGTPPQQSNQQLAPIPLTQKKGQLPAPSMPVQQQAQQQNVNQMKPQAAQAQKAVQQAPIKSVGTMPPAMDMPKQEIGDPVQLPKMADFFGNPTEPMDPKQLPVPPTEKEQDLQDLMKNPGKWNEFKKKHPKSPKEETKEKELSLARVLPVPPPMEDKGDHVQVGNVEQPAFQPPSEQPVKKKVSARKKKR